MSIMVSVTKPFASHTGHAISPLPSHCSQPGRPAPAKSSFRFGSTRLDASVSGLPVCSGFSPLSGGGEVAEQCNRCLRRTRGRERCERGFRCVGHWAGCEVEVNEEVRAQGAANACDDRIERCIKSS